MYISRLELHHVRSFDRLDLDFTVRSGPRRKTVLIGRNGTCKTTLLRAIAIGLADRKDAAGLLAEPTGVLVTEGKSEATIGLELQPLRGKREPRRIETTIRLDDGQDVLGDKSAEPPEKLLVCAYGVGRSAEGPDPGRQYRIADSVYTLFRYDEPLLGTELTLRRLHDYLGESSYDKTMSGIKRVLGLAPKDKIEFRKGGGVQVSGAGIGKGVPLEGWADGYRMTFNWLLDLYGWAMRADCVTESGGIKGIVLVDELEQHIHPSMQAGLLPKLTGFLPDLQIITTTHSPLVALSASSTEVVVLKRQGERVLAESAPDLTGYSAEDVLVDPDLFDTSAYPEKLRRKVNQYRRLASKKTPTAREKKQLARLASDLTGSQVPEVRQSPVARELRAIIEKHNL